MKIESAKVMITGANRGIGMATAMRMAERRAHLICIGRSFPDNFQSGLEKKGAQSVRCVPADLSSQQSIEKMIDMVEPLEVDILFNNAGQLTGGLVEEQNLDEIYSMFQVNVLALIHICHQFIPGMVKRGKGKIINHSSVSAVMPFPCASTYAASKAAVSMFTRCLQGELMGTGVSTLTLVTPSVETRMYQSIPEKFSSHLDVSFLGKGMVPEDYAEKICRAVETDQEELKPSGTQGLGLLLAQTAPRLFQKMAGTQLKR